MKKPLIEFKDVSFQYHVQSSPTLKHINLTIYEHEKVLIVGASGSGKSTLGHLINGLIPNTYKGTLSGELYLNGKLAYQQSIFEKSQQVGTLLQDSDSQFVGLTVAEDIAFALENQNVAQPTMQQTVNQVAQLVEIDHLLTQSPFDLSGGQKQKTTLAGILVFPVQILLFDEPLANLDPKTGVEIIELIDELHHSQNKTTIIIEHRLEDVLQAPIDRIILMDDGEIKADMTPNQLLQSNLLNRYGIREPIYLKALKQAQIDLSALANIAHINSVQLTDTAKKQLQQMPLKSLFQTTSVAKELLKFEQVSFAYEDNKPIFKNLNLTIRQPEMIALVGHNGAGKSTLAKLMSGFEKADQGKITIDHVSLNDLSIKEIGEKVGYVLQNPNQMISQTMLKDEVALALRLRQIDEMEIAQRVEEVLAICNLSPFIDWPISALSYGQKKRVTIASILILQPNLIILDEPTAGQDEANYHDIMQFLQQLYQQGKTILMVTHDMHLMLEYAQRAIVIGQQTVLADDYPLKILAQPELVNHANLKTTSLFQLAAMADIDKPLDFIYTLTHYENEII